MLDERKKPTKRKKPAERATPALADLPNLDRLLTINEFAHLADVRVQRAWALAREGHLPGLVRIGRQMRCRPDVLAAWLAGGGAGLDR